MATTYTLISSNVLGSATASVTFSSIPATYTDLLIKASIRDNADSNSGAVAMTFNSSTSNYSGRLIYGDGNSAASAFLSGLAYGWAGTITNANYTANSFSNHEIYIPSYTSSNYKLYSANSVVETNATTANYLVATAGLWAGTSAISSITLAINTNPNFAAGSSFYLYGISNA
jgi:hypothetical protein